MQFKGFFSDCQLLLNYGSSKNNFIPKELEEAERGITT